MTGDRDSGAGNRACRRLSGGVPRARTRGGPKELRGLRHQPRLDRVPLDVQSDAVELPVSDKMVVALVLPEWFACTSQDSIGFVSGETLQRTQPPRSGHVRRDQHVDMTRHHNIGVELVAPKTRFSILQGANHQPGDLRTMQEEGAAPGGVEEPVHGNEGSSAGGQSIRWERAVFRKAAMKPKGDKERLLDDREVGRAPFVISHLVNRARSEERFSTKRATPPERRWQAQLPAPPRSAHVGGPRGQVLPSRRLSQ